MFGYERRHKMTDDELISGLSVALTHAGGTHTLEDVADALEAGDAQIWKNGDAVAITEINQSPQKRTCRIWLAAGEMDALVKLTERIEGWAKDEGCDQMALVGRKGWERFAPRHGWQYHATVMAKEL